jgi:hypothetical protein
MSLFSEMYESSPAKLLPTPSAVSYGSNQGGGMGRVGPVRLSLETMARRQMWPTPQRHDATGGRGKNNLFADGHYYPHDLADAVKPEWTLSAAASPARTSVSPERAQALRASARDYGRNTPELLAKYDPYTSSWRTSQLCLDGDYQQFSETWPRSGTMRNGTAYLLPPLVRLTDETDCGSWRTPQARDGDPRGQQSPEKRMTGGHSVSLAEQVIWPTPQARDSHNRSGQAHRYEDEKRWNLQDCLASRGQSGSLNPTFVEFLMGFSRDYTET